MADLDVAVRLKFLTTGEEALKTAARDLNAFGKASAKLSGAATGRLGGSLTKTWTATVKLGGALDKSAGAATRTATALNRIGNEARDIDRTRTAVDRLAKSTTALSHAERRAAVAGGGIGASGVVAAGAIGGAAARKRREARREFLAEAASHMAPAGYLVGAGAAVAGGAVAGVAAYAGYKTLEKIGEASIGKAISREAAFVEVQKKVNLEVGQSWAQIDRQIADVSTTLGKSYEETAAVFDQFGAAGIFGKDLKGYAMLAAQQSSAWGMGMRESALNIAETRAQMGKTLPEMEVFGEKINFLGDISPAAEKDIAAMSQRAIAAMKAAGVGEDPALALMTG